MANIIDELNKAELAAEGLKKNLESMSENELLSNYLDGLKNRVDISKKISEINKKVSNIEFDDDEIAFDPEEYYQEIYDMYDDIKELQELLDEKDSKGKNVLKGKKRTIHEYVLAVKKLRKAEDIIHKVDSGYDYDKKDIEDIQSLYSDKYSEEYLKRKPKTQNIKLGAYADPIDKSNISKAVKNSSNEFSTIKEHMSMRLSNVFGYVTEAMDEVDEQLEMAEHELFETENRLARTYEDGEELSDFDKQQVDGLNKQIDKLREQRKGFDEFNKKYIEFENAFLESNDLSYLLKSFSTITSLEKKTKTGNYIDVNADAVNSINENNRKKARDIGEKAIEKLSNLFTDSSDTGLKQRANEAKENLINAVNTALTYDLINVPNEVRKVVVKSMQKNIQDAADKIDDIVKESYINTKSTFINVDAEGNKDNDSIEDISGLYRELRDTISVFINSKDNFALIKGRLDEKGNERKFEDRLPDILKELNKVQPEIVKKIVEMYDLAYDVSNTKGKFTKNNLDVLDLEDQMGIIDNDTILRNVEKRKSELDKIRKELRRSYSDEEIKEYEDAVSKLIALNEREQEYYRELNNIRKEKQAALKSNKDEDKVYDIEVRFDAKISKLKEKYNDLDEKSNLEEIIENIKADALGKGADYRLFDRFENTLTRLLKTEGIKFKDGEKVQGFEELYKRLNSNEMFIDLVKVVVDNLPMGGVSANNEQAANDISNNINKAIRESIDIVEPTVQKLSVNLAKNAKDLAKAEDTIAKKLEQSDYNFEDLASKYNKDAIETESKSKIEELNKALKDVNSTEVKDVIKTGNEYTKNDIDSYRKELRKTVPTANQLRNEIINIQNALNRGDVDEATIKLHNLKQDLVGIIDIASNDIQLQLTDNDDITRINNIKKLIPIIKEELSSLNLDDQNFISGKKLIEANKVISNINKTEKNLNNAKDNYIKASNTKNQAESEIEYLDKLLKYRALIGEKSYNRFLKAKEELQKIVNDQDKIIGSSQGIFNNSKQTLPEIKNTTNGQSLSILKNIEKINIGAKKEKLPDGTVIKSDEIVKPFENVTDEYDKALTKLRQKTRDIILNSIVKKEEETGKSMELPEKLDFLRDQLKQFVSEFGTDSKEYVEILKYVKQVENQLAKENKDAYKLYQNSIIDDRKQAASSIFRDLERNELESGQQMPLADKLEYLKSAMTSFVDQFGTDSDEYIQILRAVRKVEDQIHAEKQADIESAFRAQEQQTRELQQQAQQQEQAYNRVLSTVKRFADGVNNALKRVLSIVRKVISGIVNTVKAGFRVFNSFTNTIKRIIQLFGNFGNRVKGVQHDGNILKGTFTELKSKIDLLVGAYNKLFNNQFIENGKKLLQSIQTMNITLGGELTDNTIRWSKELERAFGVSAKGLVSQLQGINAELYGMGMDSGSTEVAGRNLAAVAQTLSGITGYDYETVISKIESGMKGMTQSIDDLGLSVRESQMNSFLKDLRARGGEFSNVATSFEKLNEQQRIYVRYAALMTQFRSRFNAEDYVKSLDSITGRLSILQARIESFKTTIGNFVLQLLDKITIPLATFITFIENKIIALAKVFGIDLNLSSTLNKSSQSASNAAKDLGDVDDELNNIEKSADKAKGSLDSFDHISNISSSNGNNDNGSDFDYSKLLTVAPDYAQELEDIAKLQDDWLDEQWKKIQAWLKEKLQEIKDAISAWWLDLTGRIINWDVIANNLKQAWENIKETFSNLIDIAKELFNIIAGLVGMILDDLDFTELLVDITGLLASITGFVKEFLNTVREPLFDFYNNYLRKYVIEFGDFLHRKINEWIGYFDGLTSWAKSDQGKKDIDNWFDNLGKKIEDIVKKIRGVGYIISTVFLGKGKTFAPKYAGVNNDKLVKSSSDKYEEYGESGLSSGYLDAADSLNGIFTEILSIVGDIGKDIGEWWNTPDTGGLATLKKDLERIDTILSENHEGFVQVIESIASSINKIKEATLNKILDILEWISKNQELVTGILSQISDILVMLIDHIGVIVALIGVSKLVSWGAQLAIILGQLKLFAGIDIVGGILGKIKGMSTKISTIIGQLSAEPLVASIASTVSTVLATIGVVAGAILGILDGILLLKEGIKLIVDNFSTAAFEIKNFWSAITGEQVLSNQQVEDNADTLLNNLKAKYGEKIPLSGLNEALTEYNNNLVAAGELSQEKIDEYVGYTEQMIIKTGDVYDDTSTAMSDTTKTLDEQIAESKVTINDYESNYKKANSNIRQSNATTKRSMSGTLSTLTSLLNTVRNLKNLASNPIKFVVSTVGSMAVNAGINKVKSFFGHANGGVPNKGSLFMANENGMPELVGNFGGYAGVANQQMIIEAMQKAIGSSVYEAVSQAMNNTDNGYNTPTKIEICKQGMFVGDDNAVRKLARTLQNSLVSSKGNISNIDFSTV